MLAVAATEPTQMLEKAIRNDKIAENNFFIVLTSLLQFFIIFQQFDYIILLNKYQAL